jgi:hypothetical protein
VTGPTVAQLLAFEGAHHTGNCPIQEERIRVELGVTPARYMQLLRRAIATDEAAQLDPILTRHLRTHSTTP